MFRLGWSSRNDVFYVFVLVIIIIYYYYFLKVVESLKLFFYETSLSNHCGLLSIFQRHDYFDFL